MSTVNTRIRLFGQFRNVFGQPEILVPLDAKKNLTDLKTALLEMCPDHTLHEQMSSLLQTSVFATETKVLQSNETLGGLALTGDSLSLAILPPVSGG